MTPTEVLEYVESIRGVLLRRAGNWLGRYRDQAEDAVQEMELKLWRAAGSSPNHLHVYRFQDEKEAVVRRRAEVMLRSICTSIKRGERRREGAERLAAGASSPDPLTPRQREAYTLHSCGHAVRSIGRRLGISGSAAARLVSRAYKKLGKEKEDGQGDGAAAPGAAG